MNYCKELVRNINKGKNLDENIPAYKDLLFDIYNQAALLHITMEYYVLYESLQESTGEHDGDVQDAIDVINEVAKETFSEDKLSDERKKELVDRLLETRDEVIRKMKILTMYTDKLQIYEHVLNRMELKYTDNIALGDVDTFVQKVYQYIFSGKDQVVINENIKEILAELPVRMARSKYFQLIENSMSVYKDSDKSAVDRYVYMLETSAMLYEPEGVDTYFPEVKEFVERLSKLYFSALSEAEYHMICDELQEKAVYISRVADLYVSIQGMLNNLYCYLTSLGTEETTDETDLACAEIVRHVAALFAEGKWKDIKSEISEKLVLTEGKQEKLVEDMLQLETVLMDLKMGHGDKIKELQLEADFDKLYGIQQLMASSGTFVDFKEEQVEEPADEEYIKAQTNRLLEKLTAQFAANEMCINRAVIAATISKFPVFFTSSDEVEEYIRESLVRCQDDAERQASMNVIQSMMEE